MGHNGRADCLVLYSCRPTVRERIDTPGGVLYVDILGDIGVICPLLAPTSLKRLVVSLQLEKRTGKRLYCVMVLLGVCPSG